MQRHSGSLQRQEEALGGPPGSGPAGGSFDFVLAMGQDDALLSYVGTLDMLFAPITCTTASTPRGSEAAFYVRGVDEARAALSDLVAIKTRDLMWGGPAMTGECYVADKERWSSGADVVSSQCLADI